MSICPEPTPSLAPSTFLYSHCRRARGALAFDLTCLEIWTIDRQLADGEPVHDSDYDDNGNWINDGSRDPGEDPRQYDETQYPHTRKYELSCREDEICVDGYGSMESVEGSVAYCVSTDNFRQIAVEKVTHVDVPLEGTEINSVGDRGGKKRQRGLEVVLTKPDHKSMVYARRMRVQAQTFGEMYGTKFWRTMKDGRVDCKRCPQLEMRSVPVGTTRVHVDVMLGPMDIDVGGLMYLFSV